MKILLTGGLGFIGSHICEELLARDHQVTVYDDNSTGMTWPSTAATGVIRGFDLGDPLPFQSLLKGMDAVCHQAARSSVPFSMKDPIETARSGSWLTANLLEAVRQTPSVKRFSFAGSSSVYGNAVTIHHATMYQPESPYAASKAACELLIKAYIKMVPDVRFSILRYYNVFGPRQRGVAGGALVPNIIRALQEKRPVPIQGTGTQKRYFVYVRDVVHANVLTLEHDHLAHQHNIHGDRAYSVLEMVAMIADIMGIKAEYTVEDARPGDVLGAEIKTPRSLKHSLTPMDVALKETIDFYSTEAGKAYFV